MERKDHQYDIGEDGDDSKHLATICHREENAEDVQGQQGDDGLGYHASHHIFHFDETIAQGLQLSIANAQTHDERQHQGAHYIE